MMMNYDTLAIARLAAWVWEDHRHYEKLPTDHPHKAAMFSGDSMICLAVDCKSQTHCGAAPLTDEDAAILGYDGHGFGNDHNFRRYIRSLNL